MDLFSLPAYPKPEEPAPAPEHSGNRGKKMLLHALVMLAFWSAIYILHEQVTWITAAEKQAREREETKAAALEREDVEARLKYSIEGRWRSQSFGALLTFTEGKAGLICGDKHLTRFLWKYTLDKDNGILTLIDSRSGTSTSHKYRIRANTLEIWELPETCRECGIGPDIEGRWRFER